MCSCANLAFFFCCSLSLVSSQHLVNTVLLVASQPSHCQVTANRERSIQNVVHHYFHGRKQAKALPSCSPSRLIKHPPWATPIVTPGQFLCSHGLFEDKPSFNAVDALAVETLAGACREVGPRSDYGPSPGEPTIFTDASV